MAESLIDAHVHLHRCHAPAALLSSAARNFEAARRALGKPDSVPGILMLAQIDGEHGFDQIARDGVAGWRARPLDEAVSVALTPERGPPIVLIAGRQLQTAEGLEILALGALSALEDRRPVAEMVVMIDAAGGLPVIPWGFGKWWGTRGRILAELVGDTANLPYFAVGDSASRPSVAPAPALLAKARARGRHVLPGSDPLPLSGEESKPGRLVFAAPVGPAGGRPFADLRDWLRTEPAQVAISGRFENPVTFLRRQVALRMRGQFADSLKRDL